MKRKVEPVPSGIAHIKATFNNTIITITDPVGNALGWASAGKANFSGSKKSSSFAANVAAQQIAREVIGSHGLKEIEVKINGPGAGREAAVRGLQSSGLAVTLISDTTPIPHNGCRPKKQRRV